MKPLYLLTVLGWMIADTFRQAWASRIAQLMLAISAVTVFVCLSLSVEDAGPFDPTKGGLPSGDPEAALARKSGVSVLGGRLSLGFGMMSVPFGRDATDAIRLVQVVLSAVVAGIVGLALLLVWTAGFLPAFLHPSAITVVLTRPAPRWALLLGKFLGVMLFVFAQVSVFVLGTWLALAVRTGVVDGRYLLTVPLLVFEFGWFYAASALLAVSARSTVACAFGAVFFFAVCFAINFERNRLHDIHSAEVRENLPTTVPAPARVSTEVCYWLFPKPHDAFLMQFQMLGAGQFGESGVSAEMLDGLPVTASLLSSLLFPLFLFGSAWWEFREREF